MKTHVVRPVPTLIVVAAVWGVFLFALHPWLMNWGSTRAEQTLVLPGDDAPPSAYFTQAITIEAPPVSGLGMAPGHRTGPRGLFSNDWLENLALADIHNADTLRAEWQQRAIGDRVPMTGSWEQRLGGDVTLTTINVLVPESAFGDAPGRFVLLRQADDTTRLLLREKLAIPERSGLTWVLWDPMHFVMEQRLLRGIKERAEGQPLVPPALRTAARMGAGVALCAVFVSRPRWWLWLAVPVGLSVPSMAFTGDIDSALAGFMAIGITLAGALAFGWRWWPLYVLLASGVALVLLLARDSYTAFGLLFLIAAGALAGMARRHVVAAIQRRPLVSWPTTGETATPGVRSTRPDATTAHMP